MKKIIIILFFTLLADNERNSISTPWEKITLDTSKAYLVFRGTDSKPGAIAREFNLFDLKSSHVGIAVFNNDLWNISHIVNTRDPVSDLKWDTFASFLDQKKQKVFYASVWEINSLTPKEFKSLKGLLETYRKKQYRFDQSFSIKDDNRLYCSELIQKILTTVNADKFQFKLHTKKLRPLYASFFRKDSLSYYPVDMFQKHKNFTLVEEWDLN